jgi:hypothetical protein
MRTNRIAVRPDIRSANTCAPGTSAKLWRCKMPKPRTIALLIAAVTSLAPHNNSVLAETQPCRPMEYERNPYTICEVDLRKHILRLYWKHSDGTPYAYLSSLPRALTGMPAAKRTLKGLPWETRLLSGGSDPTTEGTLGLWDFCPGRSVMGK